MSLIVIIPSLLREPLLRWIQNESEFAPLAIDLSNTVPRNTVPRNTVPRTTVPRTTETPKHRNTEAPKHRSTETPKHRNTEAPKHRSTEAPKHRSTEAPKHRSTEAPNYRTTEPPSPEPPNQEPRTKNQEPRTKNAAQRQQTPPEFFLWVGAITTSSWRELLFVEPEPLNLMNTKFSAYANPDALVDCQWLEEHLKDDGIRIVESNEDILLYDTGHIPGAVHIDWRRDLQDQTIRDYIQPEGFAELCRSNGITPDTTIVFYGDKSNWWACYALWVFSLFGHSKLKVLDGGRDLWLSENRPVTREVPQFPRTDYPVPVKRRDDEIRAFYADTLAHAQANKPLVDVRSPGEFSGEITHMPEYPQEGVLRGGHIPGAKSCPWKMAANDDSTFKTRDELKAIYEDGLGLKSDDDVVAYCRIGERSSHTWFVLTQLLGYPTVRNYDGSWTEWGNMVRSPVEKNVD